MFYYQPLIGSDVHCMVSTMTQLDLALSDLEVQIQGSI